METRRDMRHLILFATVYLFTNETVMADSAAVPSGVKFEVTTHARYDSQCQPNRVSIKILEEPTNGKLTVEPKTMEVRAGPERDIPQQAHCVGKIVEGVAIYYQSKPGFVGQDSFRYRRLNPRDQGDRFNTVIEYSI